MARRRGAPDAFTFDLVPDDVDAGAPGSAAPDERRSLGERALTRLRTSTRRQRAVAAATVLGVGLAVGGGVAISSAVQAHQLAERLRSAPGGVVSLPDALTQTWVREDAGGVLAVLPDGGILTSDGTEVVAIDVVDGSELWRVEVGPDVDCGPPPRSEVPVEWTLPSERVVCLTGPAEARTVTVLDAEGTVVGRRALDERYAGDGVFLAPAADGALAVLERSGTLPERMESDTTDELFARLEAGWSGGGDAVLRLEDALTGETRAEATAPSRGIDHLWECAAVTEGPDGAVADFDAGARLVASPVLVEYRHCGVDVALASDGARIDPPETDGGDGWYERVPYPDGGLLTSVGPHTSRIVDPSGEVLVEVPGWVVAPMATDGTGHDAVLAVSTSGELLAFERDGNERWRADVEYGYGPALVRAGGVFVVDLYGALVAVDLRTGKEVWHSTELGGEAGDRGAVPYVLSAVTDGATALVSLVADGPSPRSTVVRLDLATGTATPTGIEVDGMARLSAVDGNVVLQVVGVDPETGMYGTAVESVRGLGSA